MALVGDRTYVGFGFGPIQVGLFLREAFRSGNYSRLVVACRKAEVTERIRRAGGMIVLNIAHPAHIESVTFGPVEIYDTHKEDDRQRIIEAIGNAKELGTAVSSVSDYASDHRRSIHRLLAAGLAGTIERGGPDAAVYAAENDSRAAEILKDKVLGALPVEERRVLSRCVSFVNTVIDRMCVRVTDGAQIQSHGLVPVTPHSDHAILVEPPTEVLISKIELRRPFICGMDLLQEKGDLLPFEEAKFYGHNAVHALGAYVGAFLGLELLRELAGVKGAMDFLRRAYLEESGTMLIQRHRGKDPLFSMEGIEEYADRFLERMMNPFISDSVERVGRDVRRKLGWNDRLIGTMRRALEHRVVPHRFAIGAAAALFAINKKDEARQYLEDVWMEASPSATSRERVLDLIDLALRRLEGLREWRRQGREIDFDSMTFA